MATITPMKSGRFRVQFRVKGLKLISRTFQTRPEADSYQDLIANQIHLITQSQQSKLPINMAELYLSLHQDVKEAAENLPVFLRIRGDITSGELTLSQLIDDFMRQYNKKDVNLLNRLGWWSNKFGCIRLKDISEDHVRQGINLLLSKGLTGSKGVSPQTTNRFKANLSSVFEFGKDKYNLKLNPCRFIKSKPEGKGRKRYLTIVEQQHLLLAARKSKWDKFYLLILMAITSGARRSELLKLKHCDIDWDNGRATCRDTKNGSDKTLMFTTAVKLELMNFRKDGAQLLFGSPRNPCIQYDFRSEWSKALCEAGITEIDEHGEKLVFHSLRHTFCSTLANTGAGLHEIASLAGHKSIQTTMRYTHTGGERLLSVLNNSFGQVM
jgi:integrase